MQNVAQNLVLAMKVSINNESTMRTTALERTVVVATGVGGGGGLG